jgi:hypothetical protein
MTAAFKSGTVHYFLFAVFGFFFIVALIVAVVPVGLACWFARKYRITSLWYFLFCGGLASLFATVIFVAPQSTAFWPRFWIVLPNMMPACIGGSLVFWAIAGRKLAVGPEVDRELRDYSQ